MIKILYVDDEELLLDLAKIFLERSGDFVVDITLSPVGIIDSPAIDTYDAIVSDYQMPEMDGIEFLKAIRERYPDMPFILFTGRGREEVVIEAINNGADFYLQKGGDPRAQFAELSHKISQAVKRRTAERDLERSEERFSQFFHSNPAISGLSDLKTGIYIDVNDAFLQRLSYTRDEIIGKSSIELEILTPESRVQFLNDLFSTGSLHNYRSQIKKKSGEILHVLLSADIIKSYGDELLLVQAVDISDLIKSEEALKESEYRLRSFINNTTEAFVLIDEEGKIIEWNPSAVEITGIKEKDAIGHYCWELMVQLAPLSHKTEEHYQSIKEGIETALNTGVPINPEPIYADIIRVDGTPLFIRQTTFPIPTTTGFRFGIIIEDITRRKSAEEKVRTTLHNLERSQKIAKVGNWTLDLISNHFSASDNALEMFGLPQGATPTFEEISSMIHPEDRDYVRTAYADALQSKESYLIEMRVRIPDSGEIKYLSSLGEIERNPEGKPVRIFGVNQDITNYMKTSQELAEQEMQFRTIIDNLPISISIVSFDGEILYTNTQAIELFGLQNLETLKEISVSDLWIKPKERMDWIHKIRTEGVVKNLEMELQTYAGIGFKGIGNGIIIRYQNQQCILAAIMNG